MTLYNHKKYINDTLCKLTTQEATEAFRSAYTSFLGQPPTKESLTIIVAQSALETGWWKEGLHCWNFGNTRCNPDKLKDDEFFTMFKCSEIIKGKEVWYTPPQPESVFQAFKSKEDGAKHHIKFLATKDRYKSSWSRLVNGDYQNYIDELYKAGYFTANFNLYKKVFLSIYNKLDDKIESNIPTFTKEEQDNMLRLVSVSINQNFKR